MRPVPPRSLPGAGSGEPTQRSGRRERRRPAKGMSVSDDGGGTSVSGDRFEAGATEEAHDWRSHRHAVAEGSSGTPPCLLCASRRLLESTSGRALPQGHILATSESCLQAGERYRPGQSCGRQSGTRRGPEPSGCHRSIATSPPQFCQPHATEHVRGAPRVSPSASPRRQPTNDDC